jgi:hypothetical protein
MTTITINERSKAGKNLLELAQILAKTNKGIDISTPSNDHKTKKNYNSDFVKMVLKSAESAKKGNTTTVNPNDIWGSLGLK